MTYEQMLTIKDGDAIIINGGNLTTFTQNSMSIIKKHEIKTRSIDIKNGKLGKEEKQISFGLMHGSTLYYPEAIRFATKKDIDQWKTKQDEATARRYEAMLKGLK